MKAYYKDSLLVRAIEAHKKIVTEGENVNLDSIGYEYGTPINHVYTYNAIMILGKLEFPHNEATQTESDSTKFLEELAKSETDVESIINRLIEYRNQIVNP
ncbi:MAG: hypothetical protein ACRDNG_01690 [Gaiellaceae bacterium]